MFKLMAQDIGEVRHRAPANEDSEDDFDGIPYHADRGCFVHPSCLTCPLPGCRLVDPEGYRQLVRQRMQEQIVAAVLHHCQTVLAVAKRFGRSEQTVYKTLAQYRKCPLYGGTDNRLVYTKRAPGRTRRSFHCRECQHLWRATDVTADEESRS